MDVWLGCALDGRAVELYLACCSMAGLTESPTMEKNAKAIEQEMRTNLQRMHYDAGNLPGPVAGGPPWLNSVEAVDPIIRGFVAEISRRLAMPDGGSLLPWVKMRSNQLDALFLGRDSAFSPNYTRGPWNTPDNLGGSISVHLRLDVETHHAVRDAFMVFALVVITVMEKATSDDGLHASLEAVMVDMRNALLGVGKDNPFEGKL